MDIKLIVKCIIMEKIKITISNGDRVIIIPMTFDKESDSLEINEIQIEPVPEKDEDISGDIIFNLAQAILSIFNNQSNG